MRLLAVHAHPDDETLSTGITLASYAAAGHDVHVLTCTLGEEGEVIPPDLAHLEGAPGDPLGPYRLGELRSALTVLGVTGHLLAPPTAPDRPFYRDSGMAGSAAAGHPRAFAGAPLQQVAQRVGAVLDTLRPDVVITYDARGGYEHPDHIRCHDAVVAALRAVPASTRPHLYVRYTPVSWERADRRWLGRAQAAGRLPQEWIVPDAAAANAPSVVPDALVTHTVIDPGVVEVQAAALRAHTTQVIVASGAWALSNLVAGRMSGREGFAKVDVATGGLIPRSEHTPHCGTGSLGDG